MRKVIMMGAGGRDFHNFNVVYRRGSVEDPQAGLSAAVTRLSRAAIGSAPIPGSEAPLRSLR
jgi:hypothetical protein